MKTQPTNPLDWLPHLDAVGQPITRWKTQVGDLAVRAARLRTEADELDREIQRIVVTVKADVATLWSPTQISTAKASADAQGGAA